MNLEKRLYRFLREGDDHTTPPEELGLTMELGKAEHKYLARVIAAWLRRRYNVKAKHGPGLN